ncbi:erythroblast NAD(P)(+)--arginine ADP-ribosyltransferase-like [Catharus ustulatus]|uniref:erythroblast NAD(P)(+)--arginine ADP-ribosyltransferase-like n=1 Tax=Catharus ustulatus TaxID=91951 RepID=UPI00140E1060|nr:erythroblast NAD(P)(+)--arginine ADP-ribosyltransferase-like [Catharus ustulatus]
MALLVLTLALLAMTMATTTIEEKPLDMALNSFDDQYQGCGPAMKAKLPALNRSEFQDNSLLAQVWPKAKVWWQRWGSPVSPLSSPDQAIAINAYNIIDLYEPFNDEVRVAGRSPQEYRDNFHFKTLHFLLTDALAMLRAAQGQQCRCVFWGMDKYKFKANVDDVVRLGQFASSTLCENGNEGLASTTVFKVQTSHGVAIKVYFEYTSQEKVLIPPFEKFKVTKVIEDWEKVVIHLDSIGTYSKYNCEWLTGGNIPRTSASSEDDHQGHQDSQRNKTTKTSKATTATMAALAIMASMWSLWSPLAL